MSSPYDRRYFLQASAALGGALFAGGVPLHRGAESAPVRIEAPVVDRVVVQEVTDGAHDVFLRGVEFPGLAVQRTGYNGAEGRTLHSEWGLALHIESEKGGETRRYLLDFGFTPEAYANNLDYLKIDPRAVDALILSHGHFDHCGGLIGFLEAQRAKMRNDLRLYTGGEDNFCHRLTPGVLTANSLTTAPITACSTASG
jgi:7,8-dihydropterin-6-yl-methyl-4-(beta-D-ribofuranosyl)aminobenzene 5'-phosphate synthase